MRSLVLRLRSLFRRDSVEQELDEEMRYHLDRQIEVNLAKGLSPEEARRMALLAIAGVEQRKEECRDTRRIPFIENLIKDLRYAGRMMKNSPGFTITAILTVALGIGVNTTLFSTYNAVALKPLPVSEPERVVRIKRWFERSRGDIQYLFSYPEYIYSRDHNDAFASLIAASWPTPVIAESEKLQAELVSANYFAALGINAQPGRTFLPDEDRAPGANAVAVLSNDFWQRHFHGDPQAVGKVIRTKDAILTIIGVTPKEFTGTSINPQIPDFWAPISMQAQLAPGRDWLNEPDDLELQIIGRLKPSATITSAQSQIDGLMRQFSPAYIPREKTVSVTAEHTSLLGNVDDIQFKALVAALMLVVGLVLLVACANIANMLLARSTARRREIGIRLAIGAGRGRIVRQLLTESLLLSLLGGIAGLVLSVWTSTVVWSAIKQTLAGTLVDSLIDVNFTPDVRVFTYALLLSVVTGVIFGLSPALQATKPELMSVLKGEDSMFGRRVRSSRLRGFLIVAQVAVSMLFLVGAGLLVRGALRSHGTEVGFDVQHLYQLSADFGNDRTKALALQKRLTDELQTLPELKNAARGQAPLFGTWTPPIVVEGSGPSAQPVRDRTLASFASETYLDTLGIALVRGRTFTRKEADEGAPLAIISESTARRFWPGRDPISQHFKLDLRFRREYTDFEVIGVANDVRSANPTRIDPDRVYVTPRPADLNAVLFRVRGDSPNALAAVRRMMGSVNEDLLPGLSLINIEEGPLKLKRSMIQGLTVFLIVLACIALIIAATGIYSVMAHLVSQRVKEIGIRVALGATQNRVLRAVVLPGLRPVLGGLILGSAGGLGLSWLAHTTLMFPESSDFFYGVPFYDPVTFLGLSCFVVAVAAIASLVPARRALNVDPMVALREE